VEEPNEVKMEKDCPNKSSWCLASLTSSLSHCDMRSENSADQSQERGKEGEDCTIGFIDYRERSAEQRKLFLEFCFIRRRT
jgi:hypothetical protein